MTVPFNKVVQPGPKEFDLDLNQVSITEARRKAVDFSSGYYDVVQTVITNKGSAIDGITATDHRRPPSPIVLFEPLVRAAGNDIDRILSVRKQVEAVLQLPKAEELIPPEFLQLWDTVLRFSLSRRRP